MFATSEQREVVKRFTFLLQMASDDAQVSNIVRTNRDMAKVNDLPEQTISCQFNPMCEMCQKEI